MTLGRAAVMGLLSAGLSVGAVSRQAVAADLTVALPTGPLDRVLSEAFVTPFAESSHLNVGTASADGSVEGARAARADVAVLAADPLAAGCRDGSLQKLDWSVLGGRDRELPGTASDCGAGAALRSLVLSWNRDKFSGTPTWAEFWDVAKVPGKRGLRRTARTNLEIALLADGVGPADVYGTLRGDGGVDRAFRKLDQLKPYIVWWQSGDEAPKLLESGEVLMTSAPAEGIIAAQRGEGTAPHPGFALQWAGSLGTVESWAILANAPGGANGLKLLAFAADPKNQRKLPSLGGYGGTTTGADDGLPPELLAASPSAPNNLASALMVDTAFWRENGAKLDKQFEAWLAK